MYDTVQSFIIRLVSLNDLFPTVYVEMGSKKSYQNVKKLQVAINFQTDKKLIFLFRFLYNDFENK